MIKTGKYNHSDSHGAPGFTLLEILIAMALLAISITVLVELFSANLRNIATSQNYVPAVVAAEAKMSEMMTADVFEENTTNIKTDEGYRIEVAVSEVLRERMQSLPVKLLDIQVTVRWIMDRKEKTFRLHSYKVIRRPGFDEKKEGKTEEKSAPPNEKKQE